MSSSTDTLLDEIDELKDQLHNMHVDLKKSNDLILYQKEQLEIANERIADLLRESTDYENEVKDLETTIEKMEEEGETTDNTIRKLQDEIKSLSFDVHRNDEKYFKVLAMWETVREGNMNFLNTRNGSEFMAWAEHEFITLAKRRRT